MAEDGEAAAVAGGHRRGGELGADGIAVRLEGVLACVEIKILRRVCAESSRRPPRRRRDACSMAW